MIYLLKGVDKKMVLLVEEDSLMGKDGGWLTDLLGKLIELL